MNTVNDILLINRQKSDTQQLAATLQQSGYTVHTAMEMRGALSALATFPIGLIICDKDLRDIGGNEFLGFIKKDPLREAIPFIFLVPLKDQGRPFKAFELGALDYLVYPMDSEVLIDRISDVLEAGHLKIRALRPERDRSAASAKTPQEQKTKSDASVVTTRQVEISRDGIIWLRAVIKDFSPRSLCLETSLFGKTGVAVMIRFKQSDGTFIINGRIKTVSFNDFQKPAGLEITVEDDNAWRRIHGGLEQSAKNTTVQDKPVDGSANTSQSDSEYNKTIVLPYIDEDVPDAGDAQARPAPAKSDSSYDTRFYHSIIGKQLDNYRAITLIGTGNMGGVLQGWDVALEREVALKIISYQLSSKENFREMFIKEARVISKLNHPNIAQIYHIGRSNDILFYAMEFIDGITLKQVIKTKGNLDYLQGLDYLITVCEAFETVSRNSIVHRDLKPANIMITTTGLIKIVDFGVAKSNSVTIGGASKNMVMGTPSYMSPEQIARLAIDHRSDMYSLGATFYHAFSGSPPFKAEDIKSLLKLHLKANITPLCEKNPKISLELSKIIEKMMAKDPNHRFDSFNRIVDELKPLRAQVAGTQNGLK